MRERTMSLLQGPCPPRWWFEAVFMCSTGYFILISTAAGVPQIAKVSSENGWDLLPLTFILFGIIAGLVWIGWGGHHLLRRLTK